MFWPAPPKSNGMIVQLSTVSPAWAARLIRLVSGPFWPVPKVT